MCNVTGKYFEGGSSSELKIVIGLLNAGILHCK